MKQIFLMLIASLSLNVFATSVSNLQHMATFKLYDGVEDIVLTQDAATTLLAPSVPIRENYAFIGWEPDVPTKMPAEDVTYTAQWFYTGFTTYGDSIWTEESSGLWKSGTVVGEQKTWLEKSFMGGGRITFQWKIKCHDNWRGGLTFYAHRDPEMLSIALMYSDIWNSQSSTSQEAGMGTSRYRWDVSDCGDDPGSDYGWIQNVIWTPTLHYTKNVGGQSTTFKALYDKTYQGEITIPATHDGCPVTAIADEAFKNCYGLTAVTIPESVRTIGDAAFRNCASLTTGIISENVTSIGEEAFWACSALDEFYFYGVPPQATQTSFPEGARGYYSVLFAAEWEKVIVDGYWNGLQMSTKKVTVTFDAKSGVGGYTEECLFGEELQIPEVSKEGDIFIGWSSAIPSNAPATDVVYEAQWLSEVLDYAEVNNTITITKCNSDTYGDLIIPAEIGGFPVVAIGNGAFRDCNRLTSVTIPENVTEIGNDAFRGCNRLTSVTLPESVTTIGTYAFYQCSSLESVTLPQGITTLSERVFSWCTSLKSLIIPNGVTTIGVSAFDGCSALESIVIPASVKTIDTLAFWSCNSLTDVEIPEGVTSIGYRAFYNCSGLTSITIPSSVTSIGNSAFDKCDNLTKVFFAGNPPQCDNPAFPTQAYGYYFASCADAWNEVIEDGKWKNLTMRPIQQLDWTNKGAIELKVSEFSELENTSVMLILADGATLVFDQVVADNALCIISEGNLKVKVTNLEISQAQLDAMLNTDGVKGRVTKDYTENLGYTKDGVIYPLIFRGTTDANWDTLTNWYTGTRMNEESIYWIPYANSVVPGAPDSNIWDATLLDGELIGDNIAADSDGYKVVNATLLEGWESKIGVMNNVHLKIETLKKLQSVNGSTWRVDATSKITVNNKATIGTNDIDNSYYVDAEEGLVFVNMPMPGGTSYLGLKGSIKVKSFAAAQTIGGVILDMGNGSRAKGKVVSRLLYAFTTGTTFSVANNAVKTNVDSIPATAVETLRDIGDYTFETKADGYYVNYVAYGDQYTITFDANGGEGGSSELLDYDSTLTAPNVTREGYTFVGWSPEVPETVPDEDVTYTAQWEALPRYDVVVKVLGEGSVSGMGSYWGGAKVTLKATSNEGAVFCGWSTTPVTMTEAYTFVMPEEAVTLTAYFAPAVAVERYVNGKNLKTEEEVADAIEEYVATNNLMSKEAAVQAALDAKEVYTAEALQKIGEMAFEAPVIVVKQDTIEIAIKLKSVENLSAKWQALALKDAVLTVDEATGEVRVSVKKPENLLGSFYKFVVDEQAETTE